MGNIVQWRAAGEVAKFPFQEEATLKSTLGLQLPESFLVDAQIFFPAGTSSPVHLSSLLVSGAQIRGTIKGGDSVIANFTLRLADLQGGTVSLVSPEGIARGVLILGRAANQVFSALQMGENLFEPEATAFEGGCCFALPKPVVNSILQNERTGAGKVALVEGKGVRLVKLSDSELRLDAVGATDEKERCCPEVSDPIRQINEARPDSYGGIHFNTEPFGEPLTQTDLRQALRVNVKENGLVFYLAK